MSVRFFSDIFCQLQKKNYIMLFKVSLFVQWLQSIVAEKGCFIPRNLSQVNICCEDKFASPVFEKANLAIAT